MSTYLLGIDQGTSGSRALIIDPEGQVRGYGYRRTQLIHPRPDWTEQDPQALAEGVRAAIDEALSRAGITASQLAGAGIACQRNTEFLWETQTGQAFGRAITWQDLRTVPMQAEAYAWAPINELRRRLGYLPGPYSSALHLAWRMRHQPEFRKAALAGTLQAGFSAEWLLVAMGRAYAHQMDRSLVQAMGLFDFRAGAYWQEWLQFLEIPPSLLPHPQPTLHHYGELHIQGHAVPVQAMIGDQQAALFGYDCRTPGDAECTHGTASFVNVFMGPQAPEQPNLNVYYAWDLGPQGDDPAAFALTYCLEADTTVTGAALRWMAKEARLLDSEDQIDQLAAQVPDAGGVSFVPAFTGLNVPHHDRHARATLLGMTLGTTRAHIARAFLEAIGYQLRGILETIRADTGVQVSRLHVGGGIAASDTACQIQADLTGIPVIRPAFTQTTARAAALLAGLGARVYAGLADLPTLPPERSVFEPRLDAGAREAGYARWQAAVQVVQDFAGGS